jgi:dsDNA-binding SOS-regulon protein
VVASSERDCPIRLDLTGARATVFVAADGQPTEGLALLRSQVACPRLTAAPVTPSAILPAALMTGCLGVPTMIEIEFIVKDSKGVERLRTRDKKEADAYDRILENAERLAEMLCADQVVPSLPAAEPEELTIYLARRARDVERILKGKAPEHAEPEAEDSAPGKKEKAPALRVAG